MNTTQTGLARHLRTLVTRQETGALPDSQLLGVFLSQRSEASFAAILPIDPSAADAKSRNLDIVLAPARRASGSVIGPEGAASPECGWPARRVCILRTKSRP